MTDLLRQAITTCDLVAHALSRDLDRTVLIGVDDEVTTAGQMRDAISRFQQVFENLEPTPRRAAILARNRVEVLYASNGLGFAGIVTTTLHPMGSVDDYLYVIEDAGIDTLVYDGELYEEAALALKERAPQLRHFLAMGAGEIGVNIQEASLAYEPRELAPKSFEPGDLFRIAYSGGTTGKPKGIMCSHQSATTSALIQLMEWEWPDQIRHLICAPLSHSGAAVLTSVLSRGGYMVVMPGFDPVETMKAIEQHRITSVLMVPTMVIAMMDHPRFGEFDLSSLEVIFYGASAFPAARLREAIEKLGPIFFQFYGQAEAPMSITVMRRNEHDVNKPERIAGCGRPTTLVRVALMDDDMSPVAAGEPGEICVRGPLLMSGYLNKPEETATAFEGGWLHTGDVAIASADGFLRIVDRKKDMIVSGGFNIYAREVEDVIVDQPGVRQAAVIGVPDPKWGEAVKAVVVLDPGAAVTADDIIDAVRNRKGAVQAPKSVDFVEALPLSPLGKPDKKTLRARYNTA
jgi:fatty-acyl-CoA synthase